MTDCLRGMTDADLLAEYEWVRWGGGDYDVHTRQNILDTYKLTLDT